MLNVYSRSCQCPESGMPFYLETITLNKFRMLFLYFCNLNHCMKVNYCIYVNDFDR
jgi:hypothetical protein